jgi:hypothetical protein
MMRTDANNNPAAFTTAMAREGGLVLNVDYEAGDPFDDGNYYTARLLGDPVALTVKVIDTVGFFTKLGVQRWEYIGVPKFVWDGLTPAAKTDVIGEMYRHEGGTQLVSMFPNYGKLKY